MREIKFRAWDTMLCEMFEVYTLSKYEVYAIQKEIEDVYKLNLSDCELMQFTGLLDKNGVKVFEGDIVNVSKNFPEQYEIIYQDISFRFKATKNNHFVREGSIWSLDLDFEFEVIGNIYEHPHLLHVKDER